MPNSSCHVLAVYVCDFIVNCFYKANAWLACQGWVKVLVVPEANEMQPSGGNQVKRFVQG